jgi:hypothetical protein
VYADVVIPNYGGKYQSKGTDFLVNNVAQYLAGGNPRLESSNRLRYAPINFS